MSMTSSGGRHARNTSIPDPRPGVVVAVIAVFEFFAAWRATSSVGSLLAVVAVVGALVAAILWPSLLLVAVFPGSFLIRRIGPGGIDMSVADGLTYIGVLAALPSVPWNSRAFRRVLYAVSAYCGVVAIAVIAHPSFTAAVEVGHRFAMVVGTVCIGAAVVHRGKVTPALRALVIAAVIVAGQAIIDTLTHDLEPAYAFGMQKNASGALLATTIVCVYFGRKYLRWPSWWLGIVGVVLLGGLASTQSRGSAVGLGATVLIFMIRSTWSGQNRRAWKILPLVLILGSGLGVAMVLSYQHEAAQHAGADYKFSSAGSREVTYAHTWSDVIVPNLALGAGPKWFRQKDAPATEPHNLVLHELSSDGFIGLLALVVVFWTVLKVAGRAPPPLGEMAFYVLIARIISDLFDIFWVAGPNTLPFLVLGLAVGAASLDEADEVPPESSSVRLLEVART